MVSSFSFKYVIIIIIIIMVKKSHYRPGQALRVLGI
jgi:hypothetical protein